MTDPQMLMVNVTDLYGKVEAEPLVITVQGECVSLECAGLRMEGFVGELREALEPKREVRAA